MFSSSPKLNDYILIIFVLISVNGQEVCIEVNEPVEQVHYYKHGKEVNCLEGAQPYHRASYPYDK